MRSPSKFESFLKSWLHKRREKRVLDTCGCACYCPNCKEILNDQADCEDTDLVRYKCNKCNAESEWDFDKYMVPVVVNRGEKKWDNVQSAVDKR